LGLTFRPPHNKVEAHLWANAKTCHTNLIHRVLALRHLHQLHQRYPLLEQEIAQWSWEEVDEHPIPPALVKQLLKSDSSCVICGCEGRCQRVLRIVPCSLGGPDRLDNLMAICPDCPIEILPLVHWEQLLQQRHGGQLSMAGLIVGYGLAAALLVGLARMRPLS